MKQSGRQSAADRERTLVRPRLDAGSNHLLPPADLDPTEARIFVDLLTSTAPDHFRESDVPLMVEYCRQAATAQRAAAELRANGPVTGTKISPWLAVQQRAGRAMGQLAAKLRLCASSRSHPRSVARQAPTAMSVYEREAFGYDR